MKKSIVFGFILLALTVTAYAQLDWMVTDLKCGNGQLDQFELCEEGVEQTRCEIIGELLKVATACDTQHCTCLPRVIKSFCGNDIREGIELCDGTAEDFCPEFGERINLTLKCNSKCGCDIVDTVPDDYDPEYLQHLQNETQKEHVCGDKQIDGAEQCDPPGTLCTTNLNEPGKCSDKCVCDVLSTETNASTENKTAEKVEASNETKAEPQIKVHELNETEKNEESEPGFFTKIWRWIVSLFS